VYGDDTQWHLSSVERPHTGYFEDLEKHYSEQSGEFAFDTGSVGIGAGAGAGAGTKEQIPQTLTSNGATSTGASNDLDVDYDDYDF
jgi:hypothetical protein